MAVGLVLQQSGFAFKDKGLICTSLLCEPHSPGLPHAAGPPSFGCRSRERLGWCGIVSGRGFCLRLSRRHPQPPAQLRAQHSSPPPLSPHRRLSPRKVGTERFDYAHQKMKCKFVWPRKPFGGGWGWGRGGETCQLVQNLVSLKLKVACLVWTPLFQCCISR